MEQNELLINVFKENSIRYNSRIAACYEDVPGHWLGISWSNLYNKTIALACTFLSQGIKKGDSVGILSPNMPEWTITDFAAQMLGVVTVPIYTITSEVQVSFILDETETSILFVGEEEQYLKALKILKKSNWLKQIIVFDKQVKLVENTASIYFEEFLKIGSSANNKEELSVVSSKVSLNDLCTIIYTSGTSGEPKGVMLNNIQFSHCIKIHKSRLDMRSSDISLCFLPLSHIFERGWTANAFCVGMTVYYLRDPKRIIEVIRIVKPTIMCAVPRFFEKTFAGVLSNIENSSSLKQKMFFWALKIGEKRNAYTRINKAIPLGLKLKFSIADALVLKKGKAVLGGCIRYMPCAGAPLSEEIIRFFHYVGINIKFGYGLTETTATVSCFLDYDFVYGSVGKVMPEVEVKIGDNEEILVRGKTVTPGYYKKPEENANAFTDDWFHTGDAGWLDENGNLFLKDRIKDIFKTSSGKFVAPQLLESLVSNDKYIDQIAVIGDEKKYISALIVPDYPKLLEIAAQKGLQNTNRSELIKLPEIIDFYMSRVEMAQKNLSPFEQIKKITLLEQEFSILGGELTTTLKVKRNCINEKYKSLINSMYPKD